MAKYFLFFSLLLVLAAKAQVSYPVSTYQPTSDAFKRLLLTNQQIEDNDTINEEILDLFHPVVLDSVIKRKEEHHHVFLVGWLIHTFGRYGWRAMNMTKEKFVGTIRGDGRSGSELFTEYDIDFDLYFHLKKYLWHVFSAYDRQGKIKRQDVRAAFRPKRHRTNYTGVPFQRDSNNIDMYRYRLHCELTPPRAYRPMINYMFYPTLPGIDIDRHANFMNRYPSVGFYGTYCLDCNHNCHPELHPYEWLWWMNLHNGTEKDKTFLIGLMKEGSNRFPHWSHNPKTGKTCVPFAYKVTDRGNNHLKINIDHLVFGNFIDSNLAHLNIPATTFGTDQGSLTVNITDSKGAVFPIHVTFNFPMVTTGIKYWISDVNWDETNQILSGLLNFGTSVMDVYTTRVTFSQN